MSWLPAHTDSPGLPAQDPPSQAHAQVPETRAGQRVPEARRAAAVKAGVWGKGTFLGLGVTPPSVGTPGPREEATGVALA